MFFSFARPVKDFFLNGDTLIYMGENESRFVFVSNLDSTEQLAAWKDIHRQRSDYIDEAHLSNMIRTSWTDRGVSNSCCRSNRLCLESIKYIAGILRTAYLYSSHIVVNIPTICDGIFFMLLGPYDVNNILGETYGNKARIIVSGQYDTLQESIANFFTEYDGSRSERRVAPKRYCIFDTDIACSKNPMSCHENEIDFPSISAILSQAVYSKTGVAVEENIILDKWNEWLKAEKEGIVEYRKQENPSWIKNEVKNAFEYYFDSNVHVFRPILETSYSLEQNNSQAGMSPTSKTDGDILDKLASTAKRSVALQTIENSNLCDDSADENNLSKSILKDWYQFVYMKTMADTLNTELLMVGTTKNSFIQTLSRDKESKSSTLSLDGKITHQLGEMPYTNFSQFCYLSRSAIEEWRACNKDTSYKLRKKCMTNIAFSVQRFTEQINFSDEKKDVIHKLILTCFIAVLSSIIDVVLNSDYVPMVVMILMVWLLNVATDLFDFVKWANSVQTSKRTVIYMRG